MQLQQNSQITRPRSKTDGWRSVLTTLALLILAPIIALFLTTFVFQTYQVDGPSMQNTLETNDRLIVWKIPRTWARLTGNQYIPKRGDIIVFTEPKRNEHSQSSGKQLIKRVIALPGERVIIDNSAITVFNDEHPNGFLPDSELTNGSLSGDILDTLEVTVPQNHVFVAGDNRSNSLDSRSFGPLPVENIVGKLSLRILPFSDAQRF